MLSKLILRNFKNFRDAELTLGPLSLLVGTNASGKSNLRDAFRFLHGISRGYGLAEIMGEKWIEGGVLQWKGIRGGTRETPYQGETVFRIEVVLSDSDRYCIEVDVGLNGRPPRVIRESLWAGMGMVFDTHPEQDPPDQESNPAYVFARLPRDNRNRKHGKRVRLLSSQPVLSQMVEHSEATKVARDRCGRAVSSLASMRFLDLSPEACRMPSIPGQTILGDRGENLSSVLHAICESESAKLCMLEWLRELTPVDVMDLEFVGDQTGKLLLSLVESSGQRTSAYSASDGTLRFLAVIAAMMGPSSARLYFIEELENGIHPTRLHLLVQLLERITDGGSIQVVATTHSPQLISLLGQQSTENASLVYRLEWAQYASIKRLLAIPSAKDLVEKQDLAKLLSAGWLEDAVAFTDTEGERQ